MKKQQSLLILAVAGVAIAFTSGCASSQQASLSNDQAAANRWVSASGWTPITDIQYMNKFPMDWSPVMYRTTTFHVPVDNAPVGTELAASVPEFNVNLQPGDAFVEAAGAAPDETPKVKRVIRYTPFSTFGSK